MPCQACNADSSDERTLTMTKRDGEIEHLEMGLCETCFLEVTAESWIEGSCLAVE